MNICIGGHRADGAVRALPGAQGLGREQRVRARLGGDDGAEPLPPVRIRPSERLPGRRPGHEGPAAATCGAPGRRRQARARAADGRQRPRGRLGPVARRRGGRGAAAERQAAEGHGPRLQHEPLGRAAPPRQY